MDQPLVSVLMTAYNREQYVAEAIESVLKSTYKNFELIFVDDCSTDSTVSIAESYAALDSRIKIYLNEKNLGDYRNRNRAAGYATGEYIMSVDSDDRIYGDGIERCVSIMLQNPDAEFGTYSLIPVESPVLFDPVSAIQNHYFSSGFLMIGPGGTIIKTSFFKKIGGFPEKYGPANDMYYNLKAASQTTTVLIPFIFHFYRRHEGQEINNAFSYLYNNYRYNKDALEELDLPINEKQRVWLLKKNKRRFAVNLIKYFIRTKDWSKTLTAARMGQFKLQDALEGLLHFSKSAPKFQRT